MLGIALTGGPVFAQAQSYKQLSAQWWQWALSIPGAGNPLSDTTGASCMVGQRGPDWFLAGTFGASAATRSCSIPAGVSIFFPVVNFVGFDTPGECGQGDPLPSSVYRAQAAEFIDGVTSAWATLDGKPVGGLHRTQSQVFEVALPKDNLFAPFCPLDGVYSPAVDDGIYVRLNPLSVGEHDLRFRAEGAGGFVIDVTYHLTVVPVVTR